MSPGPRLEDLQQSKTLSYPAHALHLAPPLPPSVAFICVKRTGESARLPDADRIVRINVERMLQRERIARLTQRVLVCAGMAAFDRGQVASA